MLDITRYTGSEGKCISQIKMSGYERQNSSVSRRCLKIASDRADVTWGGRSFHVVALETGKARLPNTERRTDGDGNIRRREAEDRNHCLDVTSPSRDKLPPTFCVPYQSDTSSSPNSC